MTPAFFSGSTSDCCTTSTWSGRSVDAIATFLPFTAPLCRRSAASRRTWPSADGPYDASRPFRRLVLRGGGAADVQQRRLVVTGDAVRAGPGERVRVHDDERLVVLGGGDARGVAARGVGRVVLLVLQHDLAAADATAGVDLIGEHLEHVVDVADGQRVPERFVLLELRADLHDLDRIAGGAAVRDLVQNPSLGANGFADASVCALVCAPATPARSTTNAAAATHATTQNLDPPVVHEGNARSRRDGQASSRGSEVR